MTTATSAANDIEARVRQVVGNIRNLPTPPIVFTQIQKTINRENTSAADVAKILSEDPSMSAKVLKLTNSAFYGMTREVESVKQAVLIIGFEAVKNLVLSASVLGMFKGKEMNPEFQDRFWRHSLATALCARSIARIAKSRFSHDPEAAFSVGLLHDIGKLVMNCFLSEDYAKVQSALVTNLETTDAQIEYAIFGFSHTHVGAALATNWNLPVSFVTAIAEHHSPRRRLREDGVEEPAIAFVLALANCLAKRCFADDYANRIIEPPDSGSLDYLGLTPLGCLQIQENLKEEYQRAETFLSMAGR